MFVWPDMSCSTLNIISVTAKPFLNFDKILPLKAAALINIFA
jgi:hypothetical protein